MRTLTRGTGPAYWIVLAGTLVLFTAAFLLPLVWVLLGAFKPPAELAQQPPTILPQTWEPGAYVDAWNYMELGKFFVNTLIVAIGAWAVQMAVIVPAAYALSKLRPIFGNVVMGLMLATLMLPSTAVLVPVYLTLTDLGLLNNPAGIWLPAAANALNVYLLKRFFDQIPEELLEAARIDGAGTWTTLVRIVLPISRPILAVVSIFAVVAAWKDFIWPLLVFPDPAKQTLSVALQRFAPDTPINLLLAGLVLASLPMVALFLAFQRHILAGLTAGGVKG
ncbi:carbohydrate ABC transporter permease [Lentzea flaviverrucosa]|uniref:Multiple sugar transport system permease protein n=1 Tax=Lentzea flaviverrucosa TaxID=200379 RepID=A0A1H9VN13_9PSEU|nr:carbohydrate ABC transporter permease [Lentzea flaviverrucosa]RDI23737.1 carbohydrate ABC transporter membrane protein 2 (CUT1 family) [Lentzea flaviverrucosa]SES23126.1 multiple sugar transport system permease protein [Lentzea flaviverrucosa]